MYYLYNLSLYVIHIAPNTPVHMHIICTYLYVYIHIYMYCICICNPYSVYIICIAYVFSITHVQYFEYYICIGVASTAPKRYKTFSWKSTMEHVVEHDIYLDKLIRGPLYVILIIYIYIYIYIY